MRSLRRALSVLSFFLCLVPLLARAAVPPPPIPEDIFVQDYAGMIESDDRAYMTELGRSLDAAYGAQLSVVTVESLDGTPVEDYALTLFRSWGLGDAQNNNGVLLLIARRDRAFRIEVGYGLEGAIPDSYAGAILDGMVPGFREEHYSPSVRWAYEELAKRIDAEYGGTAGIDARVASGRSDLAAAGRSPDVPPIPDARGASAAQESELDTTEWLFLLLVGGSLLLYLVYSVWAYGFWRGLGNFLMFIIRILAFAGRGGSSRGGRGGSSGGGGASGRW